MSKFTRQRTCQTLPLSKSGVSQARLTPFTSFVKTIPTSLLVSHNLLTFAQWFLRPTEQAAKAERNEVSFTNCMAQLSLTPLFDTTNVIRYMEKRVKVLKISIKQLTLFLTKSTEWE